MEEMESDGEACLADNVRKRESILRVDRNRRGCQTELGQFLL